MLKITNFLISPHSSCKTTKPRDILLGFLSVLLDSGQVIRWPCHFTSRTSKTYSNKIEENKFDKTSTERVCNLKYLVSQ